VEKFREKILQPHFITHLFTLVFITSVTLKEAGRVYRLQLGGRRFESR
jgi:hypothetical protein